MAWLAAAAAEILWDDVSCEVITRRHIEVAREAGALGALPPALITRAVVHLFMGDLATGAALVEEAPAVAETTGSSPPRHEEAGLLALRGDAEEAEPLMRRCLNGVAARGEGIGVNMVRWAHAVLANGLGRYAEASGRPRTRQRIRANPAP